MCSSDLSTTVHSIPQGVRLAKEAVARAATPVVLADHSDRSGSATWILKEVIEQDLSDVLIATIADAKAIDVLTARGVKAGDAFDMNDLIRPTLYEAWHDIVPVRERPQAATIRCDIVGPICESGDYLAQDRDMAPLAAGDLIVIRSAGAYGAVMASTYNTRPLAPEVMVDGTRFAVTRPRPSIDELLAAERFPPWQDPVKA